jgi:hypothetical protein
MIAIQIHIGDICERNLSIVERCYYDLIQQCTYWKDNRGCTNPDIAISTQLNESPYVTAENVIDICNKRIVKS